MSHETFLTTRDKARQGLGLMPKSLSVTFGLITAGLGAAAVIVGSGWLAIGLAAGAVVTGYRAVEELASENKQKALQHSHDRAAEASLPPNLANNLAPIPELADDVSNKSWRKQLTEKESKRLQKNWHGF